MNAREIHAEGFLHPNNKVTVFANSNIRYQTLPTSKSLIELREELLEKEFAIEENGVCKFLEDYIFNSPSTAAGFIFGGSNNGWDYWKNDAGIRINDCMRDTNKGGA